MSCHGVQEDLLSLYNFVQAKGRTGFTVRPFLSRIVEKKASGEQVNKPIQFVLAGFRQEVFMANEKFWLRLFRPKVDWVEDACALCEKNPLFEKVPLKSIRWLVTRMHPRSYREGEPIIGMGNAGAGAVLILSGEVSIRASGIELGRMHRGDLFGEVALAADLPRTAGVVAVQDCELVFFLRSDLQEWLAIMPKEAGRLLQNLSKMLAQRLMDKNKMIARQQDQ